jgi:hypothetical protein
MNRTTRWLLAACLLLPVLANASVVTWNVSGTLNNAQGTNGLGVGVGQPYALSVSFDTAAGSLGAACGAGVGPQVGDSNCRRAYDASSVQFTIDFGLDCDDALAGVQKCVSGAPTSTPAFASRIFVFNDFNDGTNTFDRLTFRIFEADPVDATHTMRWILTFDSSDLSTLGGLGLPSTLPSGFTAYNLAICTAITDPQSPVVGQCDTNFERYFRVDDTDGRLVPEPATAALFGAGLLGLVARRRRRAH